MNQVTITDSQVELINSVKKDIQAELHTRMTQLPPGIQVLIRLYGIVTGGISASLFHVEPVNDVDVYFTLDDAKEQFLEMIQEPEVQSHIADVNPKYMVDTSVPGKLVTAHAVTFKNGIQVVTMHLSNARDTFDFVHTMPFYHIDSGKYYISPQQLDAIMHKKLVINPSPKAFPITEKRKQKFIERGWKYA